MWPTQWFHLLRDFDIVFRNTKIPTLYSGLNFNWLHLWQPPTCFLPVKESLSSACTGKWLGGSQESGKLLLKQGTESRLDVLIGYQVVGEYGCLRVRGLHYGCMDPRLFQRMTMIERKKIHFERQSLILLVIKCQSCHSLFIIQYGEDKK